MQTKNLKAISAAVEVAPGVWRVRLGEVESQTPLLLSDREAKTDAMRRMQACECPAVAAAIGFDVRARGCVITLPIGEDEAVYGMGLQLKSFNQRGKKKHLAVQADPHDDKGASHAPVPFYVTTGGYGVLVDTARYATFHFATHKPAGAAIEEAAGDPDMPAMNTQALYRDKALGSHVAIEVPAARGVDVYFFAGPALRDAVQRYVLFSGGGALPPMWGLGVWYRTCGRANAQQVVDIARRLREDRIPCDVYGLEPGWHSHSYSCSFRWNPSRFENPPEMIRQVREMGYHLNLWEHAYLHPTAPIYSAISQEACGDLEVWGGLVPDLSLPKAREEFRTLHRSFVDAGVSGFKLDECDHSNPATWCYPEYTQFPSGLDGEQMHSFMGILYQRAVFDVFEEKRQRTWSQVRSSGTLSAPYPFVLYSDLYDHRDFIRGVANEAFCGLLWSPEVREGKTPMDLIRRIQAVIFSPMALINAWYLPNPPWFQIDTAKNEAGEAMPDHERWTALAREAFELRMRLVPYLYATFVRYCDEGVPPMRPLVMDWPEDVQTRDIDDQWMVGDDLLVAPLIEGQTQRDVYLPAGIWYCFWSGEALEGGKKHTIIAGEREIPLFVRSGAVLPLAEPVQCIARDTVFDLTVRVYGKTPGQSVLVEDDGEIIPSEGAPWPTVVLRWDEVAGGTVVREGPSRPTRYNVTRWERIGSR